jgi:tetratricopeptide (TPR) repeat protein
LFKNKKEFDIAEVKYRQSLEIAEKTNDIERKGKCFCELGDLYVLMEDLKKADAALNKSMEINQECNFKENIAKTYNYYGNLFLQCFDKKEAFKNYSSAFNLFEDLGNQQKASEIKLLIDSI